MPAGTATIAATASASRFSRTVIGAASSSISRTGTPVRITDCPKSPWTTLRSQVPYCSYQGRSSPHLRVIASICSWVTCASPIMMSTGLPGASCMMTKVAMLTRKMTTIPWRSRTTAYLSMACPHRVRPDDGGEASG